MHKYSGCRQSRCDIGLEGKNVMGNGTKVVLNGLALVDYQRYKASQLSNITYL